MLKLGIVADPLHTFKLKKDSTFAMMLEAQKRNWPLFFMTQNDLFIKDSVAYATQHQIHIDIKKSPWYEIITSEIKPLTELNVILMRKDPPFNMEYIYTTYILELAEKAGVIVANKPQSLRDCNEKLFTSFFPQCCPRSLVSRTIDDLKAFVKEQGQVVFKPLDSMGGKSIFLVDKAEPNITVILETLTQFETQFIMAQQYIPEIKEGDKRILLINGEAVPYALARIPKRGDIRGNLAAGGTGVGITLSKRDQWICEQMGPILKARGLVFVGIDVIGDYLTEINVTCPTCIQEIEAAFRVNISATLLDMLFELYEKG